MAWKLCTITTIFMASMEGVSSCKIDAFSLAGPTQEIIYGFKNGNIFNAMAEKVIKPKTPLPSSLVDNGFSSIDAFHYYKGEMWFANGSNMISIKENGQVGTPKTAFPQEVIDAGFDKIDAFAVHLLDDGKVDTVDLFKGGDHMRMKLRGGNYEVESSKKPLLPVFKENGFSTIDGMATWEGEDDVLFTLGSHYIVLRDWAGNPKVMQPTTCLPTFMTTGGFNSVDGVGYDGRGTQKNIIAVKDGNYMVVKPGQLRSRWSGTTWLGLAFSPNLATEGFDSIDAFHWEEETSKGWFAKGDEFLGMNWNGDVIMPKKKFPTSMTNQGFSSIQGMAKTKDKGMCVAASGHYMCFNLEDGEETVPKTAFPAALTSNGFTEIDGFFFDGDRITAFANGYYMSVSHDGEEVILQPTLLPATLTSVLCGSNECPGGLKLGDAGAPTTAGGTAPPAAPGFVRKPTPSPTAANEPAANGQQLSPTAANGPAANGSTKKTTRASSDANGLIPSVILLSIAFLLSF